MNEYTGGAVVLENIYKAFQQTEVVKDVSLQVGEGEFVVLLGPSGSGKTTILRMIAGFEEKTAGQIFIEGKDVSNVPPNKRGVGVVFQQLALFPHLSVRRNVAFGLEVRRTPRREAEERVNEALALVRLPDLGDRMPHQLSGGQQQRIALARALVTRPSVLLLDEPLGSLDKNLRAEMQMEIRRLQQELRISTIMVTHDQEEAMTMGDRIAVLKDGRLAQMDHPAAIYDRPCNRFVASFVGEANLFAVRSIAEADNQLVATTDTGLTVRIERQDHSGPLDSVDHIMVRPEFVRLSDSGQSSLNAFPGSVISSVFAGPTVRVKVQLSTGDEVNCIAPSSEMDIAQGGLRPGQEVFASWEPTASRLLGS